MNVITFCGQLLIRKLLIFIVNYLKEVMSLATKKKTTVKKTAEVKNSVDKTLAEKVKNLKAMTEQINAQAGKKVSGFLDDPDIVSKLRVEYLSTPCDALNEVISGKANEGGFPVGKMTVIAGQPDSGKTSLVLETIAQAQKNDPTNQYTF